MNIQCNIFVIQLLDRRFPEEVAGTFPEDKDIQSLVGGAVSRAKRI